MLRFQCAYPDDPDQALVIAALILDLKRAYMEMRPELRRVYNSLPGALRAGVAVDAARASRPSSTRPVMFGGVAYYAHVLDFGPARSTAG